MTEENFQMTKPVTLFFSGYDGSKAYRIPSLITTLKGTLIAGIDARIESERDNPNKIDTTIRRSTDNGETWESPQKLVSYPGDGLEGAAAIDTSLLQDEETGTIWMLYCHTPAGIGLCSSEAGIGFDEQGNKLLFDYSHQQYSLHKDGNVYDRNGNLTAFTVNEKGNVYYNGMPTKGNIYLKKGVGLNESLLESRTSFIQVIRSDDDGLSWSKPIDLNPQVKESWMKFIGAGPGRGLQLRYGHYKGRLVFPIYFSNINGLMSCAVIYSDDHGETWKRGYSPNDGRLFEGETLSAKNLTLKNTDTTESQVIEMPSGEIRIYMRNHSGKQRTAVATSKNGGETWENFIYDDILLDPTCQSTIITYPDLSDGKVRVLFANPSHEKYRQNGTIRLSEDGGETWSYCKTIESGAFLYSCLTVLPNGSIALLYESEWSETTPIKIKFVKFTLDWIKSPDVG